MHSVKAPGPLPRLDETTQSSPFAGATVVSIIVPTINEVDNIDVLVSAIFAEARPDLEFEILVADGGSTDGTVEKVERWATKANVRLIAGDGKRGLAGDVLTAAGASRGDVVVVMDADLSHPPDRIRALVQPVLERSCDMVVGSRFVAGGATPGWPFRRLLLSRLGSLLAWPLTEVKDPMSGFFAVRRERLLAIDPAAAGFKIGLEVIAHGGGVLKVREVPIVFPDRVHGVSKIGTAQMVAYARRLLVLAGGAVSANGAARFAAVGLIGMFVDLLAFEALFTLGVPLMIAHVVSFWVATISNYFLNSRWAFAESWAAGRQRSHDHYGRFLTVCLLALAVRGGVIVAASSIFVMPPQLAILFAIGTAAIINYLGSAFFVFPSLNPRIPSDIRWRVTAIGVVGYVVILRLLFLGLADLLPQEAYYWNYAQHLDVGYLDHPPLVAWLIWVSTSIFGNNEFGVRFAAWLGWFATAFFSFNLTQRLFGKSAAFVTLLLVAALPFYFASGFFMTPDAPLVATWAGALYFLERALLASRRNAWWGVGICIGLGMLSKYTIVLLGPAALMFILIDGRARAWLARPEPYLAAILALIIFSPAIYWNIQHDLASFAFQSTRRLGSMFQFSLPFLVANSALLLTPPALIAATAALWTLCLRAKADLAEERSRRISRFISIFTLVPLAVFLVFSLSRGVKLNWTGPLWLAVLPAISMAILSVTKHSSRFELWVRRGWAPTLATCLAIYGIALNYLVMGIPGFGYSVRLPGTPIAWSEFGLEATRIGHEVKQSTGVEPMLIGLDTYNIASQLAFYASCHGEGVPNSVGRGPIGQDSLMYGLWFQPDPLRGRPAILFAFKRHQIDSPELSKHFASLSEAVERPVVKDGQLAGHFYYRIGYGYQGQSTKLQTSMVSREEGRSNLAH